ncbi:PLC-like phosphodiesterase [Hypoxylon rubiginosum]|uniref:PLC-like phosphodiesterase n=1 Tax=Hypoxylon rubiginosum TaxID=110542 RepID=A0ACC0DHK0_9PEZI|nr:PLC-like phosphodiesterase [Hypoxylon rubiginosum]
MAIDSASSPIPKMPPAAGSDLSTVMPDEQTPLLDGGKSMEAATAGLGLSQAGASSSGSKHRMPRAVAHRGYKAAAPENSMLAFRAAVEAGAHAVETDLHLSKDGVVVLSHDATLKRCFGVDAKVRDCEWVFLSTLRTTQEPAEPMVRLLDLLEYLNEDERVDVGVLLDIKTDDDAAELMQKTAETIASVPGIRPWSERILPCCWTTEYVKLTQSLLPNFPIAHVGVSTEYARALADNISGLRISLLAHALATPVVGKRFVRRMRRTGHPVYAWTVNDEDWMRWAIGARLDGVITDDPKLFLDVCRRVAAEEEDAAGGGKKEGSGGGNGGEVVTPVRRRARMTAVPGRLFNWARYLFFLTVVSVIYFARWGLPSRQVPKVLGS